MKLYKDGQEVLVDKSQLKVLLDAGWSMTKETEIIQENTASEDIEEDDVEEVKVTSIAKPKTRKPKKISVKKE